MIPDLQLFKVKINFLRGIKARVFGLCTFNEIFSVDIKVLSGSSYGNRAAVIIVLIMSFY